MGAQIRTLQGAEIAAEDTFVSLGGALTGVIAAAKAAMDARRAEEARLWEVYCQGGHEALLAETSPA